MQSSGACPRQIRWRFAPHQAEALQEIARWDWDHASLKMALPEIRRLDIDAFIEKYR